jgi:hypothetical protein
MIFRSLLWCCLVLLSAWAHADDGITAVRLKPGESIALDGSVSHPAWQRAPVYSRFITKDPIFGAAPVQATQVQVLFDDRALYVGVTALDAAPAQIRAPIVRNDQVNRTQDFVVVYIDAIGTKRSAQFFRVNAAGSLADGLHTAPDDYEDFSPDFDWDATVSRQADNTLPNGETGWTAVFRLPFASLRFAPGQQSWRIMVARRLPREQFHLITSVPIPRDAPSFIHTMQPLSGVELPANSQFLTLRPSLTLRRDRLESGQTKNQAELSLDAKWRPLPQAVVDATWNPDFSQVALDVPQLAGNSRFALYFPEKRPFFFESADLLRTPTDAFYTRSYTEPRWGLRATWRSGEWAGTALALQDRGRGLVLLPGVYGTDAVEQPAASVLAARARTDGGSMQVGGVLAARRYEQDRGDNTVLGPDLAWQINDAWRLRGQWLHARTTAQHLGAGLAKGSATEGDRVYLRAYRQTERSEASVGIDDISSGFRHDSGFVNQAGVRKLSGFANYGWQSLGPFNQFFINTEFERVTDRTTGAVVNEYIRPGFWSTGASNLEWWFEYFAYARLRTGPTQPLLRENFVASGLVMTPAAWFPILDTKLQLGRIADTVANQARPGGSFRLTTKLRPLAALEFEGTGNTAWLRGGHSPAYSETALQALAVWHFDARHNLRAILASTQFKRGAERNKSLTQSLTYAWRQSSGTVLYVGASSARRGISPVQRSSEAFVKLQVDVDEALQRIRTTDPSTINR